MISTFNVIGFSVFMLGIAFVIISAYLIIEVNDLKRRIDGFYAAYNDIFSKVNSLYKKDHRGFSRPKVDILEDGCDKFEQSVWIEMSKLQDRIKELEGKKK